MLTTTVLPRAPRSTRAELLAAEAQQIAIIAALRAAGREQLAGRLARCQHERCWHVGSWPWRCRSAGCWSCRRTAVRRWWRSFHGWLDGPDTSLAIIPVDGDLFAAVRRLRKALRDVRDRAARRCPLWRSVAMGGMASSGRFVLLIQHPDIDRDTVWRVLEQRWPDILVTDGGTLSIYTALSVQEAVSLAVRQRGVEPIRIIIPAQYAASVEERDPMPMLF